MLASGGDTDSLGGTFPGSNSPPLRGIQVLNIWLKLNRGGSDPQTFKKKDRSPCAFAPHPRRPQQMF